MLQTMEVNLPISEASTRCCFLHPVSYFSQINLQLKLFKVKLYQNCSVSNHQKSDSYQYNRNIPSFLP